MTPAELNAFADFVAGLGRTQRLMGIDLGTKTIGLALSDVERRLASPLETLKRSKFSADAAQLLARADKFDVAGNRVLVGSESFTTCQAAWFCANGELVLANAGHLPPYLNSQEVALPGGLPLGVLPRRGARLRRRPRDDERPAGAGDGPHGGEEVARVLRQGAEGHPRPGGVRLLHAAPGRGASSTSGSWRLRSPSSLPSP